MLTLSDVYKAQQKYGISARRAIQEVVLYADYLTECRRFITDVTPSEYYLWEPKRQHDFVANLVFDYVRKNLKLVEGFIINDDELDQDLLIQTLLLDISDFGILRTGLDADDIQEIQINDAKTIWIVKEGKTYPYLDGQGKPLQFSSDEELHSTIDRLIYNPNGSTPRLTKVNSLLNTRTADQGYRLSAVNSTAITPDGTVGMDFPCTSVTIRKYAPSRFTFTDFCNAKKPSMTAEMAALLKMCGRADIRLACVGPTSSGKTTLLNAICWEVDPALRMLLIQNPTEIMLYDRDIATGTNRRNALHWEAQDLSPEAAKDPTTPTMANMIAHALRNTPDVIVPGEVRTPDEFFQMVRALKTGHRLLTSWHATDGPDAIDRASTELSTLGGSTLDHARSLAQSFDIIVSQAKLGDGSRRVMGIEELTGRLIDGRAETVKLFEFVLTGESTKDPLTGEVKDIKGYFQQCNPISQKLVQKFYSVGITKQEIAAFVTAPVVIEGASNLASQQKKETSVEDFISNL